MNTAALVLFGVWFVVIFVVRSLVQKRDTGDSGIRPGAFAADASIVERVAYVLLLVAFAGAVGAPIAAMAGVEPLWDNDALRWVGVVVAVAGIGLTYAAQVGMGSEWRIGIDRTEVTGLVTSGVFGLVRNPIFTAMIFTAVGFAVMVPNVIAVIAVVCLVVAIEMQVRFVEEPHLRRLHGTGYGQYAAEVGRFVPLIGRAAGARR
ncbi:MAG: isoprenylcysteine carboxylmethyltransferase family protein [Acidimicrobiales bacterium]|nr:isoprenylcysteine carboxylmethyltransferase family protein [Acidimicrobiales bacterium]